VFTAKLKMNSLQTSLCVLGLVLVLGTFSGEAIQCYVCNSGERYDGESCSDKAKLDPYLFECAEWAVTNDFPEFANATLCRIQHQTVGSESRIVRSCALEGRVDRCVERTGTKDVKVTYCQCEGDKCNTGSAVFASVLTVFVAAVLSRFSLH